MRSIIIILFTFFYLIISSGVAISLHYCCGELKAVSILNQDEEDCCGSKKESEDCCKSEVAFLKINDDHQANKIVNIPAPALKLTGTILPQNITGAIDVTDAQLRVLNYHGPPLLYEEPVYLQNRVLII